MFSSFLQSLPGCVQHWREKGCWLWSVCQGSPQRLRCVGGRRAMHSKRRRQSRGWPNISFPGSSVFFWKAKIAHWQPSSHSSDTGNLKSLIRESEPGKEASMLIRFDNPHPCMTFAVSSHVRLWKASMDSDSWFFMSLATWRTSAAQFAHRNLQGDWWELCFLVVILTKGGLSGGLVLDWEMNFRSYCWCRRHVNYITRLSGFGKRQHYKIPVKGRCLSQFISSRVIAVWYWSCCFSCVACRYQEVTLVFKKLSLQNSIEEVRTMMYSI